MNILVFNCGSSSLNYKVYSNTFSNQFDIIASGKAHRVGVKGSQSSFIEHYHKGQSRKNEILIPDHATAGRIVLQYLQEEEISFDVSGHRFVHGGTKFKSSCWLTDENRNNLLETLPLASIHNPNSMAVIEECQKKYPQKRLYLTFDTAFHADLPETAHRYLLPEEIINRFGFRKFGFHGLSYQYVSQTAADFLGRPLEQLRLIACHLGTGGSSVTAIYNGKSLDTTMGYTPLAGLVMSTRSGDVDPLLVLQLLDDLKITADDLDSILNKRSGLLGVSGFSSDIRDIIEQMGTNERSRLAFDMYTLRLRKVIGSYLMLMQGADALIFTDDIGLQNPHVRSAACTGLGWAGIELDDGLNRYVDLKAVNSIAAPGSRTAILAMPTDEEWIIAREGFELMSRGVSK